MLLILNLISDATEAFLDGQCMLLIKIVREMLLILDLIIYGGEAFLDDQCVIRTTIV